MENGTPQHLTKFDLRLHAFLVGSKQFYQSKKQLHPDGSFFLADKIIMKEMNISRQWLYLSKKRLRRANFIKFKTHQGKGVATDYWIPTGEQKKKGPELPPEEPIFQGTKPR